VVQEMVQQEATADQVAVVVMAQAPTHQVLEALAIVLVHPLLKEPMVVLVPEDLALQAVVVVVQEEQV
jgi:hypothetical protein